jgi:hypothetical protein
MNPDKDLPVPCPARAQCAQAAGPVSLPGAARSLAGSVRPDVGPITAPPAAFGMLTCLPPWQVLIQPAWAVLACRILALAPAFGPASLPFPQAPRPRVRAHAPPLSST